MAYEQIELARESGIAVLTVQRPKQLNALDVATLQEMDQALLAVEADPALRVLLVTGSGEKAFVAGADIAAMQKMTLPQAQEFAALGHRVMARLEGLRIPTIAVVNGFALGGGCELALACDFIYASERARFGLPEVGLGIIPGFGGTQRLSRLVGPARAKELIFSGEMIDAAKAKEIGLALEVVPAERLMEYCRAMADKIQKKGPVAVAQAKYVMGLGAGMELSRANALERQAFALLFGGEEPREGMAAFLEKRTANFQGR